jgi:hypothetical protein
MPTYRGWICCHYNHFKVFILILHSLECQAWYMACFNMDNGSCRIYVLMWQAYWGVQPSLMIWVLQGPPHTGCNFLTIVDSHEWTNILYMR